MRGQVAGGVAGGVARAAAPLVAARRQLVGGEAAGAGREAAGNSDAALAVPGLVRLWAATRCSGSI